MTRLARSLAVAVRSMGLWCMGLSAPSRARKRAGRLLAAAVCLAPAFPHETLTTTVLFDREIVRIVDKHCAMCHVEGGPSFRLDTYEQAWLQKRQIRADVIARHMPPWSAVPGYGQFANDNSLTLRETQFIVSWVEGLGPRNAGTVFLNVTDASSARTKEVRAHVDFGLWHLGEPQLTRQLSANTIEPQAANQIKRTVIDLGLTQDRRLRGLEFMPSDRRVVRAAFFTIQETGQWIGSWTPWYGFMNLPKGSAFRLPAGSHVAAEIHYRGAKEHVVEHGSLGLYFADEPTDAVSEIVLDSKKPRARLVADTSVLALRPEILSNAKSIEVSARKPDGGTEVLLFAKDFQMDWPTPYILKDPVKLPKGTELWVSPGIRVTVSATSPGKSP